MTDPNHSSSDAEREAKRQADLDRALDSGVTELPPNQVRGILGEKGPDLRVPEDFSPSLNSGISQEVDLPVVWMGIVLSYLLFFPLAFVLLWRSRFISLRAKKIATVVGVVGIAGATLFFIVR